MSNVLTDEARYKAGKSQMGTFLSNQYLMWRIVSVKSIRKIILTADEFYTDILPANIGVGPCVQLRVYSPVGGNPIK